MNDHIQYANGKSKTVCVTTVLTALGVPIGNFKYTWNGKKNTWKQILNRHGFSVRSRLSRLPKGCTVGKARKFIAKLQDPPGTFYAVSVQGHLLLLGNEGQTLIDTAPRKRDARKIVGISAIMYKHRTT